jgi:hypothetical protein
MEPKGEYGLGTASVSFFVLSLSVAGDFVFPQLVLFASSSDGFIPLQNSSSSICEAESPLSV